MIHYILVRRDLPFGVALAQTAHAAAYSMAAWVGQEMYAEYDYYNGASSVMPDWSPMTVVVLGVKDRRALKRWEKKIQKNHDYFMVREPDAPWHNQEMALGMYPGERNELEGLFSKLELYQTYEGP